ncbi:hypothetical protein JQ595_16495 [Bradyrhizobium japonicum]|uniref:hypothetical protein n=1 Tax=Bradyrhizobium japonicum TaxID=375 RepID=UPI001BAE3BC7|nr:hypothetical protein [Bradyrhizobium japonicum]MBR0730352.1 hypothetical protein [Bradyrhizobium japonicum]
MDNADDDILRGATAIAAYLRSEGLNVNNHGVYYLHKAKKLAIGKLGKDLLASKKRLSRDLHRAAQAVTT